MDQKNLLMYQRIQAWRIKHAKQNQKIIEQDIELAEKSAFAKDLEEQLVEKSAFAKDLEEQLVEKSAFAKDLEEQLVDKSAFVKNLEEQLVDKSAFAKDLEEQLVEKSAFAKDLEEQLVEKSAFAKDLEEQLVDKSAFVKNLEEQLVEKSAFAKDLEEQLVEKSAFAKDLEEQLVEKSASLKDLEEQLVEKSAFLKDLEEQLVEKSAFAKDLEEQLVDKSAFAKDLEEQLVEKSVLTRSLETKAVSLKKNFNDYESINSILQTDIEFRDQRIATLSQELKEFSKPATPKVNLSEFETPSSHPEIPDDAKNTSIVFNSMPKSASMYIWDKLSKSLSFRKLQLTNAYFPNDYIRQQSVRSLSEGHIITQDHFRPNELNLGLLERWANKIVLHMRDPRQALLSWVHHLTWLCKTPQSALWLEVVHPPLPKEYFNKKFEYQIDWNIDNYLPYLLSWCEDWQLALQTNSKLEVLVSHYEDLVVDEAMFFKKIFNFYELNDVAQPKTNIEKSEINHFRKGAVDEWCSVFTKDQIIRVNDMLTKSKIESFCWKVD